MSTMDNLTSSIMSATSSLKESAPNVTQLGNSTANPISAVPLSLSDTARALTAYLFGERDLPQVPARYAPFIHTIAFGATLLRIHTLFDRQRQSRKNIQLAVFHVVQLVERDPNLQELLQEPQKLIFFLEAEVLEMVGKHLTKKQSVFVMRELKRKIWTQELVDSVNISSKKRNIGVLIEQQRHSGGSIGINEENVDEVIEDPDLSMVEIDDVASPSSSSEDESDVFPSQFKVPSTESSSSTLTKTNSTPPKTQLTDDEKQHGNIVYGFDYDDFSTSSSSVSDSSDEIEPLPAETLVQRGLKAAFAVGARPKAVKPPNPYPRTPPNAIATTTAYKYTGTDLSPIGEDASKGSSPDMTRTKYRVAETKKLWNNLESARKNDYILKPKNKLFTQNAKEAEEIWDDPIIDWSPATESISAEDELYVLSHSSSNVTRVPPPTATSRAQKSPSSAKKKRGRPSKTPAKRSATPPSETPSRKSNRKTAYTGSFYN